MTEPGSHWYYIKRGRCFPQCVEAMLGTPYLYIDFLCMLLSVSGKRAGFRLYLCVISIDLVVLCINEKTLVSRNKRKS